MGLEAVVAPLFQIRPVEWDTPDLADLDAVVLTSANAARQAGPQLEHLVHLQCHAVGGATAAAADEAGFSQVHAGASDGAALIELMATQGVRRALHLCGRDNHPIEHEAVKLTRCIVYAAEAVPSLPRQAQGAIAKGVVALLHSPRAAALFAKLVDQAGLDKAGIAIAAISPAALAAAGFGWRLAASAAAPREEALLELAAKLCKGGRGEMGNGG